MPHSPSPISLEPTPLDPARASLAALEAQVADRDRALAAFKTALQELQSKYLSEIGVLYGELGRIETAVIEAEIRAGLRTREDPIETDDDVDEREDAALDAGCGHRAAPSVDLKRMFRDVAKAVHPDRALDERARYRRHSLMAEANRAYAERDEDRLRLILRAWESSADAVIGNDAESEAERLDRRTRALRVHLEHIDADFKDLHGSAIARLKKRIDDTQAQGWNLFDEMRRQVKSEIAAASARLAKLQTLTVIQPK